MEINQDAMHLLFFISGYLIGALIMRFLSRP